MKTLNRLTITLKLVALLVTAAMFHVPPVLACTSVQLTASDGSVVVARTMDDNPATMKINVALTPRGKTIQSTNPDGSPGFSYTTKYSSFGLPVIGSTTLCGCNTERTIL